MVIAKLVALDGLGRIRARLSEESGTGETIIATLVVIAWLVGFAILTYYILDAAGGASGPPPASLSGR